MSAGRAATSSSSAWPSASIPNRQRRSDLTRLQEIVAWYDERELMDYVTCGTGSYFDFYKLMPTSLYPGRYGEPFAAALKDVVRHAAVQAESHMRTPADAEAALAAGHADLVSIVRGQIADPHLVRQGARRGAPARCGRASRATRCAGDGAPATTSSRAS